MSKRQPLKDPVKRAEKRKRQQESGFKRPGGKGKPAQMDHASSSSAAKKAAEGSAAIEREKGIRMMAVVSPGQPPGCMDCFEAIELDRIALVAIDVVSGAEIGVIACADHLARIVQAIELLDEHERYLKADPATPEQMDRRIIVAPGVTP